MMDEFIACHIKCVQTRWAGGTANLLGRVELHRRALQDLQRLPKSIVQRAWTVIEGLTGDPFPRGSQAMQGEENLYRIRFGDYRIVYRIFQDQILVLALRVGHRKDVYRNL